MLVRSVLVLCLFLAAAPATAAETSLDFATAQERAAERDVPIVIDFFTDWCVYCKHFDRDLADASTGVAAALEEVVFLSIDAEKGEGIELSKKYEVTGFPTYVVVDAQGELIDRWAGYGGPEHFLTAFGEAMADTRTVAAKQAAFEEDPTAPLAEKFASSFEAATGDYDAADRVVPSGPRTLDPSAITRPTMLQARFMKMRRTCDGYDLDAFAPTPERRADGRRRADHRGDRDVDDGDAGPARRHAGAGTPIPRGCAPSPRDGRARRGRPALARGDRDRGPPAYHGRHPEGRCGEEVDPARGLARRP